jgi:hypothetical protein
VRINPACDDAGCWKKDGWPKVAGAKKLSSALTLSRRRSKEILRSYIHAKEPLTSASQPARQPTRLLLVHIRINFPTLFPIVCRRLFLGPRQRLLISICSPTGRFTWLKDRPANTLELDPKSCAQRE